MMFHRATLCLLPLMGVLAPSSFAHPCDNVDLYSRVCDPSTGGGRYYVCMPDDAHVEFWCSAPLVFNNDIQSCDWPSNYECVADVGTPGPRDTGTTTAAFGGTATKRSTPTTTTTTTTSTTTTTTTTTTAPASTGTCNPTSCQLPQCRCVGADIPGNLSLTDVPQMVLLTFDDAVNEQNFHYYDDLFPASLQTAIKNPNGCPTAGTFFVSGAWTNMTQVRLLVERGSEVASHSRTHSSPSGWSAREWDREIQGMRQQLASGTGLPLSKVVGMRSPYLALGGEKQFSLLQNKAFLYDSSMFGGSITEDNAAPLWPFTLKYPPPPSQAVCDQSRCPTGSYPQVWEVPLVRQYSASGSCSMTDDAGCNLPSSSTKDDVKRFLRHNFNRHYTRNRAPFMISLHATWFSKVPSSFQALKEFLQEISQQPDVWQLTVSQMLDWVRHPLPASRVGEMTSWQCDASPGSTSRPSVPAGSASVTATTASYRTSPRDVKTTPPGPTFAPGQCNPDTCKLPDCRCVGTDIPGNLEVAVVPQMVMLTFDDSVNVNNFDYYQALFPESKADAVTNPNGCRTSATFFIDGTWTDKKMVQTLADRGNEVASHSLTHTSPSTWSAQDWDREMEGMREQLANDTGLPLDKVGGMRAPFLELGAEKQFSMLERRAFLYDSSMYGGSLQEDASPPLWPFSLAFPPPSSQLLCDQPNCPTGSYPGVWEVPIIRQYTLSGQPCSMTDSCDVGYSATVADVKRFLRHNFDRHYTRNRAPFMISLHATWFTNVPSSFQALKEFLQEISQEPGVWQVGLTQMLDWVRNPLPLSRVNEIPSWQCSQSTQTVNL